MSKFPITASNACGKLRFEASVRDLLNPHHVEVSVGALDHPELFAPQNHIFEAYRISWLLVDDKLPLYTQTEPVTR